MQFRLYKKVELGNLKCTLVAISQDTSSIKVLNLGLMLSASSTSIKTEPAFPHSLKTWNDQQQDSFIHMKHIYSLIQGLALLGVAFLALL
jgi:hypothetical protein